MLTAADRLLHYCFMQMIPFILSGLRDTCEIEGGKSSRQVSKRTRTALGICIIGISHKTVDLSIKDDIQKSRKPDHNKFSEKYLQNVGRLRAIHGKGSKRSLPVVIVNRRPPFQMTGLYRSDESLVIKIMINEMIPKALFHYTTIETLALILSTQTIRFSRADIVNDLEELKIIDLPIMKESVFISCWTASEKESIPLWKMYGSNLKGVRIKLPTDMFRRGSKPYLSARGCHLINLMSLENVVQRGKYYHWIPYIFGPTQVRYSSDNSVSVIENSDLMVDRIGTVKLEHWKFENEHRYLIIPDALWNSEEMRFQIDNPSAITPIEQEYIDIPLSIMAINSIEVTLGPAAKDAEYCIVDTLLSKHTKSKSIKESNLKGKVRC